MPRISNSDSCAGHGGGWLDSFPLGEKAVGGIIQGAGGSEWKFSESFVRQESQNSVALCVFPQRYPFISRPHAQVLHSFIKHRAPEFLLWV